MSKAFTYVILGGGVVAGYAARELVARGLKKGELAIISREKAVAYERPALSKGFLFPEAPARLPGFHTCVGGGGDRQDAAWYSSNGIEYMLETTVAKVDVAGRTLTIISENGEDQIKYGKLLVASGADVIKLTDFGVPGADLPGIHYLRELSDAEGIVDAIKHAKETSTGALVIGGGYIGMECAAAVANNGVPTTLVFPETHMMSRLFTPEMATFYEDIYRQRGVRFFKGQTVTSFEAGADGKLAAAVLKDGTKIPCSMVIAGTGARPRTDLFQGQLKIADKPLGGIVVDAHMRSSDPNVFAAGDVAAFPLKRNGGDLARQEHVVNARQSAAHAVRHMMGDASAGDYDYLPFFYSRVFDLSWQFYGKQAGVITLFGEMATGKWGAYWVHEGKVVGAFLESGTPEEFAAIKVAALRGAAEGDGLSFVTPL